MGQSKKNLTQVWTGQFLFYLQNFPKNLKIKFFLFGTKKKSLLIGSKSTRG